MNAALLFIMWAETQNIFHPYVCPPHCFLSSLFGLTLDTEFCLGYIHRISVLGQLVSPFKYTDAL